MWEPECAPLLRASLLLCFARQRASCIRIEQEPVPAEGSPHFFVVLAFYAYALSSLTIYRLTHRLSLAANSSSRFLQPILAANGRLPAILHRQPTSAQHSARSNVR